MIVERNYRILKVFIRMAVNISIVKLLTKLPLHTTYKW